MVNIYYDLGNQSIQKQTSFRCKRILLSKIFNLWQKNDDLFIFIFGNDEKCFQVRQRIRIKIKILTIKTLYVYIS